MVVLSAAPAMAAPPSPSAPTAATVMADLRMVLLLSMWCVLVRGLGGPHAAVATRESAQIRLRKR